MMPNTSETRPERAALQHVLKLAEAEVRLVSPQPDWEDVAVSRFRLGKVDVSLPALGVPAFGINYGRDMLLERTLYGRRIKGYGKAGHLSILPSHADTRWIFDKPGEIVVVFLNHNRFGQAIEAHTDGKATSFEIVPRFVIRDLVLERVTHLLLHEILAPRPDSRIRTEQLAQELTTQFIDAHSTLERPKGSAYAMAPSKLRRAEDFVFSNLHADLSLHDIANAVDMSLYHFAKSFKHTTGQTPNRYVKELRLREARTLLHDARLSISQVAKAVGFSHSYFTMEFSKHLGMTPRQFRDVLHS